VRRYWVLGMECSLLEIQKLAWFLERAIERYNPGDNPLNLQFRSAQVRPLRQPARSSAEQSGWQLPAFRKAHQRRRPTGRDLVRR
jgi:hypothetical protein